jgi:ribosomal protein L24E
MRTFHPGIGHPVLYGRSTREIAEWAKVTDRTARRWKRGEEPPHAALQLIELKSTGNLGIVDPAWDGWLLKGKSLVAPHGEIFSRGDVLSLRFLAQQVAHLMSEARLPRQADWVSARWEVAKEIVTG